MWIKSACEISENVHQVATSVSTHIVCVGEKIALFDASVWGLKDELHESILKKVEGLDYLFLTHAHFDHVGAVPFLRNKFPNLKVVAGSDTVKLLSSESILEKLFDENRESALALDQEFPLSLKSFKTSLHVDSVLNEGDEVDLGTGIVVKAVFTPGHSKDSMSYLVRPDELLVVGDAVGSYNGRSFVCPSFAYKISDYVASLTKMESLDLKYLALGHSGILSGELIGRFMEEIRTFTSSFSNEVRLKLSELSDIEELVSVLALEWERENKLPEGPFRTLHRDCVRSMVSQVIS